ncbi:uncharacterized protein [Battus philenor]|uniref:uncharacterized protein n=1 Tax=Battus philenor TaxID=42288 RepID=UPI0035D08B60
MGNFTMLSFLTIVITLIMSSIWIIMSAIMLSNRGDCQKISNAQSWGSNYMWTSVYKQYFLDGHCGYQVESNLTRTRTIYAMTTATLCFSITSIFTSVFLFLTVFYKNLLKYVELSTTLHFGVLSLGFLLDLVFALHLFYDFFEMTKSVNNNSAGFPGNYGQDILRIGIFLFSMMVLKGIAAPLINLLVGGLLLQNLTLFVLKYGDKKEFKLTEHSIHSKGILSAYESTCQINPTTNNPNPTEFSMLKDTTGCPQIPLDPSYPPLSSDPSYPPLPSDPSYPRLPSDPSYPPPPSDPSYPPPPSDPSSPPLPSNPSYPPLPSDPSYEPELSDPWYLRDPWELMYPQGRSDLPDPVPPEPHALHGPALLLSPAPKSRLSPAPDTNAPRLLLPDLECRPKLRYKSILKPPRT